MTEKKYYSGKELDLMIKESLLKNAKILVNEIKSEKNNSLKIEYV